MPMNSQPQKISGRKQLSDPFFSEDALNTLFQNIQDNDIITENAVLEKGIPLDLSDEEISSCYKLCWQLFDRHVDIIAFRKIISEIALCREPGAEARLLYKHVRARFKHLRFARVYFDQRHCYAFAMNFFTAILGNLQDSFKNKRKPSMCFLAFWANILVRTPFYNLVRRDTDNYIPSSRKGLRNFLEAENIKLAEAAASSRLTAKKFHDLRKIISRKVAFYDSLRVIRPSKELDNISLYLATINGLMGNMHDRLIEQKFSGTLDYHKDEFPMPSDVQKRILHFLAMH
jgi:hypothetical protein